MKWFNPIDRWLNRSFEKRTKKWYFEWGFFCSYPRCLFQIELGPEFFKHYIGFSFAVTILYRQLFYFECSRFKKEN